MYRKSYCSQKKYLFLTLWGFLLILDVFLIFNFIIIIKLSFIARLNENNLAQKRVTEKCLIITQFEKKSLKVSFKQR